MKEKSSLPCKILFFLSVFIFGFTLTIIALDHTFRSENLSGNELVLSALPELGDWQSDMPNRKKIDIYVTGSEFGFRPAQSAAVVIDQCDKGFIVVRLPYVVASAYREQPRLPEKLGALSSQDAAAIYRLTNMFLLSKDDGISKIDATNIQMTTSDFVSAVRMTMKLIKGCMQSV